MSGPIMPGTMPTLPSSFIKVLIRDIIDVKQISNGSVDGYRPVKLGFRLGFEIVRSPQKSNWHSG